MGRNYPATKFVGEDLGLPQWAWKKVIWLTGNKSALKQEFLSDHGIRAVATADHKARGGDGGGISVSHLAPTSAGCWRDPPMVDSILAPAGDWLQRTRAPRRIAVTSGP